MNPLLTLWLIVLGITALLSGFFYMAENYAHIIGNFYFVSGAALGSYILYALVGRVLRKNKKKDLHH